MIWRGWPHSEHLLEPAEFARTRALAADFGKPGGLGEQLHARLLDHKAVAERRGQSWLEDWWLRKGYLEWRVPLPINSNWQLSFEDHPAAAHGPVSPTQRAAGLIRHALEFKRLIDKYDSRLAVGWGRGRCLLT